MEEQIPPSQAPINQPVATPGPREGQLTLEGQITPEQLAQMKARARELALQQALAQSVPPSRPPQVVYVRRNLTVAELLLVILLSCGIVTGVQVGWNLISNVIPRVEIKVR